MYFGDAVKAIYADNGSFFDLMLEDEMPKVIDYSYLNHELIISEDNELKSIEELRIKKEFVLFAKQITCQTIWDKIIDLAKEQEIKQTLDDYISMKDEDMNLLVN